MGGPRIPKKPEAVEREGVRLWKVPLSQGEVALVDDQDIALALQHSWCAKRDGNATYALTNIYFPDGSHTTLLLHQLIGGAMGIVGPVDHKDGNGLDNCRHNLRPGPPKLNHANNRKSSKRTSAYKGVYWARRESKWCSSLAVDGKRKHLGYFADEEQAARAYDAAALVAWGEYAHLNFPTLAKAG